MRIKKKNKNEYILAENIWVRNFVKSNFNIYIDINNLIEQKDYPLLLKNESKNNILNVEKIDSCDIKFKKCIIISDGFDFENKLSPIFFAIARVKLARLRSCAKCFCKPISCIRVKTKSNAAGTSATGTVNVYAYASADGSTYPEGCGTDTGVTLTSPPNLRLVGIINVVANATTYQSNPFSVAQAFGGVLPQFWGIVVENKSGAALDASIGSAWYQGVYGSYT
jgi:hypothetical protein